MPASVDSHTSPPTAPVSTSSPQMRRRKVTGTPNGGRDGIEGRARLPSASYVRSIFKASPVRMPTRDKAVTTDDVVPDQARAPACLRSI